MNSKKGKMTLKKNDIFFYENWRTWREIVLVGDFSDSGADDLHSMFSTRDSSDLSTLFWASHRTCELCNLRVTLISHSSDVLSPSAN